MVKRNYIHYIYIIYIVVFAGATLFFSACSHPEYRRELTDADSLASVNPGRAKTILDSIAGEMASAPEHERMYYNLLRIKTADKAYIKHTSDSTVLKLVDYYENGGDSRFLPETYYYAGSVYRDMNDAPRAVEYYQKAEDALKGSNNYRLLRNINAQKGSILDDQYLYEKAIQEHLKSYKYDCLLKDTVNMAYCLKSLGYIYNRLNKTDSSLLFFKKAVILAKKMGNNRVVNDINSQMASLYINNKDYDTALKLLTPNLYDTANINRSPYYSMATKIYMRTNQYDSAYKYAVKLLDIGTIFAKQTASESLVKIYMLKQNHANTDKYMNLFKIYTDSVFKINAAESVAKMNSLYNYNLREKENLELKAESTAMFYIIILSGLIICFVSGCLFIYIIRSRQKRKEQVKRINRIKRELFRQSEAYINENKAKIAKLEKQLQSTANANKALSDELELQKTELRITNENIKLKQAKNETARAKLINTEIYKTMIQRVKANKALHVNEWKVLDDAINTEIENFKQKINEYHAISMQEYRICMLVRLDISVKDMGTLLSLSTSGISKARKRLQEKFFKDEGTAKDFDAFIKSL